MKCSYCQREIIRNLSIKEICFPHLIKEQRCQKCEQLFTPIATIHCPTCCKANFQESCEECLRWQTLYPNYIFQHHAFFQYDEGFQRWIHQYKFLGDYQLRRTFIPELTEFFKSQEGIVCPIPLSEERYLDRGFNQVEAFLEAAEIKTSRLLVKVEHTTPQSEKNRQERLATAQPFQLAVPKESIENQKILLVDDVYTTGRTLFHAAELLLSYQPESIQTVSLAR